MRKEKKKRLRRLKERREQHAANRAETAGAELVGELTLTNAGFGFVKVDPALGLPDIFIPVKYLGGALDGDTVRIRPLPERRGDPGPAGAVTAIVRAARESAVGEVLPGGVVRPLNRRVGGDFRLVGRRKGARIGDWVQFKLLRDPAGNRAGITGVIGAAGSIKGDLDAVCQEYGLLPPYTAEENAEAAALTPGEMPREDFTNRFCVTIDPTDAKDFDDAVSIAPGRDRNTLEVGVHIADVAAFIAHGSKFDKLAAERAFTAYLPGRTLPMLPAALTARISLHEGEDCPAHSVILQVERSTGRVLESRRCHTLIRVRNRLDYDEVQQFLDHGRTGEHWPDEAGDKLKLLAQVTEQMRRRRFAAEKVLDLALPEVRLLCDEGADRISGVAVKVQRDSEKIVEECMLAANSAVGAELQRIGVAGLYRVHEEPSPEKLAEFSEMAAADFGVVTGDLTSRANMLAFIARLPEGPLQPLLLGYLLRALPHARYKELPELHYGLGKTGYCHFTSPIRRYPDLTVHQQLWSYDLKRRTRAKSSMARLAIFCSEREENNDNAYFTACDRLKLRYLQELQERDPETLHEGVVVRTTAAGLVVDLPKLGIFGFVPRPRFAPAAFRRGRREDARETAEFRCGDPVLLRLSMIDPVRNSAEFTLARRS